MLSPDHTVLWSAPNASDFVWRELSDIALVFDPLSGQTHLLDYFSREILDQIATRPRRLDELAEALAATIEEPVTDQLRTRIQVTLQEFDRLGLIFPLAGEPSSSTHRT